MSYLYDIVFYFLIILSFIFWGSLLKGKAEALAGIDYSSVFLGSQQQMDASLNVLQSFLVYLLSSLIVLILVMVLIFTVFKGMIWTSLMGEKRNLRYFKNLFFANALFYIPFILLLTFLLFKDMGIIAGIVFLFVMHFNALSIYYISSGKGFRSGLGNAFKSGVNVHRFILFYALFGALFFILDLFFGLVRENFTSNLYSGTVILLILVFFLCIVRNGFIKLVEKIK